MIFFTSDLHLNDSRIIHYCKRPFRHVEEMNQSLIERWNSKISDNDEVYIIGDFAYSDHDRFLESLAGKKHLISGSHDHLPKDVAEKYIESVSKYKELKFEKRIFVLSHCPLRCWEHAQNGSIHLYGHVHGRISTYNLSMDVSVDTNNLFPYSMADILQFMDNRKQEMRNNGRIFIKDGVEQYYQDDVRWFEKVIKEFQEKLNPITERLKNEHKSKD